MKEALCTRGCHTVGSLIEPVPPCVATTMSPATSSSTRTRRASEATTPSPIRWPGPAGESRPGPSAGSGRRSASPGGALPPTVVPDTSSPTRERSHRRGPPRRPEETRHPPALRRHRQDRLHRDRGKAVEDTERGPGPRLPETADPTEPEAEVQDRPPSLRVPASSPSARGGD